MRYFAAPDDHGVFVTESKLTKIANNTPKKPVPADEFAEDEINTFSMNYHTLNNEPDSVEDINEAASVNTMEPDSLNNREDRSRSKSPKTTKGRPLRRSLSMQHRASKVRPYYVIEPQIMIIIIYYDRPMEALKIVLLKEVLPAVSCPTQPIWIGDRLRDRVASCH